MNENEREQLTDIETVLIAMDDKLHKMMEIIFSLKKKVNVLKAKFNGGNKDEATVS